eukprot:TRINITY_DN8931_c0_g1_i1.p1 TRINITY_DN8931_c0_g1~~TRINITY_DN8931_c0_g1_i1.p1  ORF type:complete len:331 (-),score=157.66 TRINITY_DN8931_c0_g1_i1:765-1757(-)
MSIEVAAKLGLGEKMPVFEGITANRRELEADEEAIMEAETLQVHPLVMSFFAKRREARKSGGDTKQSRQTLERARKTTVLMVMESILQQLECGETLTLRDKNDKGEVREEERFFRTSKNRKQLEFGSSGDDARMLSTNISDTLPIKSILLIEKGIAPDLKKRTTMQMTPNRMAGDTRSLTIHIRPESGLPMDKLVLTACDERIFSLWYDGLRALTIGTGEIFECPFTMHEVYLTIALQEEVGLIEHEVASYKPDIPPVPANFDFAVQSKAEVGEEDTATLAISRRSTKVGSEAIMFMKSRHREKTLTKMRTHVIEDEVRSDSDAEEPTAV